MSPKCTSWLGLLHSVLNPRIFLVNWWQGFAAMRHNASMKRSRATIERLVSGDGIISEVIPHGGQHPIIKVPGTDYIVVGTIGRNWSMDWWPDRKAVALEIHLNTDDPNHPFACPDDWRPFPNAKKLAAAYNRPFEKTFRLRIRRATDVGSISEIMEPHYEALEAKRLAEMIRGDGSDAHISGELEYYPDGHTVKGPQVWRRGSFWLRLPVALTYVKGAP